MTIYVKLFAAAREEAGSGQLAVDLPDGATVADLRSAVVETLPRLASVIRPAMLAVNQEYAEDSDVVTGDDEVALILPVSGG